jgi:hypothetical protein
MTILRIEREYPIWGSSDVELPEGRTWQDIESWYVKWEIFFYKFKDEEKWREHDLSTINIEDLDLKRPKRVEVGVYGEDDDLREDAAVVDSVDNW